MSPKSTSSSDRFDVVIVGAGVVGAAIAQALSFFDLRIALIDSAADVGTGTSKANSAILHTGFDATPGTLESDLVRRGHELLNRYAPRVGIPLERTGALMVAWNQDELALLNETADRARANGYVGGELRSAAEVYALEPSLGPGVSGAFSIPDESIICPFTTPLALATEAVMNGATLMLDSPLTRAVSEPDGWTITCGTKEIETEWVVNAAGLFSDRVAQTLGQSPFDVLPRKGQFIVFDKFARTLVSNIILGVPTQSGKGVLVAPTVFGYLLLGPTAEDLDDKTSTETTLDGLDRLLTEGRSIVPALSGMEVTATYAGLRAVSSAGNYDIGADADQRYARAVGIRSTGLTASMAIAELIVEQLGEAGLTLRPSLLHEAPVMNPHGVSGTPTYLDTQLIAENPDVGTIDCFCELVNHAELEAALRTPIPPVSIDGLRRRTRATGGRCQGFYCEAKISDWFDKSESSPSQASKSDRATL